MVKNSGETFLFEKRKGSPAPPSKENLPDIACGNIRAVFVD